jgi:citrate synthase
LIVKSTKASHTLDAQQAAARLGVKVATLYAYVSRGLLTRLPGGGKASRFDPAEVERLAAHARHAPSQKPQPLVITSALTEIRAAGVYYRGHSVLELAATHRFEAVAEWLWGATPAPLPAPEGSTGTVFSANRAAVALARALQARLPADTLPIERLRVSASVLGSRDAMRYETSPAAVVATARTLMASMIESLPEQGPEPTATGLAARLWARLCPSAPSARALRVLSAAMVLCADHALSPSTLAVRIAASQLADPYAIVQTGMGALSGTLHGAASLAAEELIEQVEAGGDPSQVIGARLRRAERIPGFGHSLHHDGDPRAAALLPLIDRSFGKSRGLIAIAELRRVMHERALPTPNIDFALAALARCARMTRGSSEAIMAIARIAGWIAHALEEYATPTRFPWHAAYIGPSPQ